MSKEKPILQKNYYHKEQFYKKELLPKINEIRVLCVSHHMPMFCTVAVANDEKGTKYQSEMVMALSGTHLEDNRISKLLLYLNDFDLQVPDYIKRDVQELEEYVQAVEKRRKEENSGVTLKDDKIAGMQKIVECGNETTFPSSVFSDDEGEELDVYEGVEPEEITDGKDH